MKFQLTLLVFLITVVNSQNTCYKWELNKLKPYYASDVPILDSTYLYQANDIRNIERFTYNDNGYQAELYFVQSDYTKSLSHLRKNNAPYSVNQNDTSLVRYYENDLLKQYDYFADSSFSTYQYFSDSIVVMSDNTYEADDTLRIIQVPGGILKHRGTNIDTCYSYIDHCRCGSLEDSLSHTITYLTNSFADSSITYIEVNGDLYRDIIFRNFYSEKISRKINPLGLKQKPDRDLQYEFNALGKKSRPLHSGNTVNFSKENSTGIIESP